MEWTKVDDRLPIDDDEKLITVERKDGYRYTTVGVFHPDIKRWSFATIDFCFVDVYELRVVAWAPMPKPFVTDRNVGGKNDEDIDVLNKKEEKRWTI